MGTTTKEIGSSSFNDMISSVDRRSEYVENRAGANVRLNNFLTPYTLDDKSSILNAPCGYSNGVYPSLRPVENLGPELVAETPSNLNGWIDARGNTTLSIVDNNIRATLGTGTSVTIGISSTGFATVIGKTYSFKIIGTKNNTNGNIYARISTTSLTTGDVFNENNATNTISVDSTFVATSTTTFIGVLATGQGSGDYVQSSLMSVRELLQPSADFSFTRGSAATRVTKDGLIKNVQILSDELVQNGDFSQIGSELVINGDFATDTNWTKGTGWSIQNGYAQSTALNTRSIYQNIGNAVVGRIYKVTYTILETNGGNFKVVYGGVNGTVRNSEGTYVEYLKATSSSDGNLYFDALNVFIGKIDNVSVKEVGQNWNFVGGANMTDNGVSFIDDGTNIFSYVQQLGILTSGRKYRVSFDVIRYVSGLAQVELGSINTPVDISSGVGTYTIESESDNTFGLIKRDGSSPNFDFDVSNISIIEITDDTDLPRIDYTNGTGSLLLEPQSTNLITYSEDFSQWGNARTTDTANQAISPDGNNNASIFEQQSGQTNAGSIFLGSLGLSSGTYTQSIFAKKKDKDFIVCYSANAERTYFNLSNGTIGTVASGNTAKIEDYGNGWYRCAITYTITTGSVIAFYLADTDNSTTVTDSGGVYVWGAQLEQQSYPTSYIPTLGSTVTRNADVCNNAGSSDLISSTEGVLYAEISSFKNGGIGDRTISLSDGSTQNAIQLLLHNTANRINFRSRSGGSLDVNISDFTFQQNQTNKIACKFKSGDYALWVNGEERVTSSSSSLPTGLSVLAFDDGSLNDFYGNVRSVAVFKEALTDEELAKITSTTQQEVFYEMRDKMLQINADYYEFGDYTTRLKKLF
jgi:hypothetical protein